jgi:hypothetical protein
MQFITTKYTGKSEACPDETTGIATSHLTDKTTGRTTSHLTNPAKDAGQVIDETTSHLTKAASCQVIGYGYSHSTGETTSHSTRLPKDGNQVAGYRLSTEELLMELLAIPLGCQRTTA